MLLVGDPGTGKTYFMYALMHELLKSGWPLGLLRFINGKRVGDMFDEEHKLYGTSKDTIRQLVEPAILFVDDFGVEGKSERIERNYYEITDNRLADDMPTVFSTNLSDPEIKEVFGSRIDSRLKQCVKIHFEGNDQRQAKPIF
jgi:DNA replication protein DnaC